MKTINKETLRKVVKKILEEGRWQDLAREQGVLKDPQPESDTGTIEVGDLVEYLKTITVYLKTLKQDTQKRRARPSVKKDIHPRGDVEKIFTSSTTGKEMAIVIWHNAGKYWQNAIRYVPLSDLKLIRKSEPEKEKQESPYERVSSFNVGDLVARDSYGDTIGLNSKIYTGRVTSLDAGHPEVDWTNWYSGNMRGYTSYKVGQLYKIKEGTEEYNYTLKRAKEDEEKGGPDWWMQKSSLSKIPLSTN
jgi:hypothetical protein